MSDSRPPGHPGISPRWTSSAKSGVGTAATQDSRIWFTLSHGIVDEVYYPRIDQANTRDFGFLVTDRKEFFSEEKRHTQHAIDLAAPGVPAYHLVNTCVEGRYRLTKRILTDPTRDVLLQSVRFEALQGRLADYSLYVLLAPHIANAGFGNTAWVGDYKGIPMAFASRDGTALALSCSTPFRAMSSGFVGVSDGWQDISTHKRMTWAYPRADDGNVALTAEIDLDATGGEFVLALGFGRGEAEAGHRARAALLQPFEQAQRAYVAGWQTFQRRCDPLDGPARDPRRPRTSDSHHDDDRDLYRLSTMVLKVHEAKHFAGGMIASLSIPWGMAKSDDNLGGYHLVWPRDLVESAGGLLAAGDTVSARNTLTYLMCTQEADGHWPQNMWLDGTPYWSGIQMDETAFPILLADALRRLDALDGIAPGSMVRRAASYLVCNGPVTGQDRWEEDGGYSPFTLAVEIAALLAAADFASDAGDAVAARYLRETADIWNGQIERWTYVTGTELARFAGVEGYYVRIAPQETADAASPMEGFVPIKNRPPEHSQAPLTHIVSPDALALVRFGLRAADDPRVVNTVKVIDRLLKTDTATGPVWHRYNEDGYGEHEDGSSFDGTGIGRGWPLLAGERAHFELARGKRAEAERLRRVMVAQCGPGGLFPEQVWDAADLPDKELLNGQPTGSAMPLCWAHAEYIKLLRSLRDKRVFDLPPQPVQRYQVERVSTRLTPWRYNQRRTTFAAEGVLRVEVQSPAVVQWSADGGQTVRHVHTTDTTLGMHFADLPTESLAPGDAIAFEVQPDGAPPDGTTRVTLSVEE